MPIDPDAIEVDNIYSVPRDCKSEALHFVMVQVSEYRYAIAKYTMREYLDGVPEDLRPPTFLLITKPMKRRDAEDTLRIMYKKRRNKNVR